MVQRNRSNIAAALSSFSAALLATAAFGCNKAQPTSSGEHEAPLQPLIHEQEGGSIAWTVTSDGKAHAVIRGTAGAPSAATWSGTLQYNGRVVRLLRDGQTGALDGAGPPLTADITQIGYALAADDGNAAFNGVLHLPHGGTRELADAGGVAVPAATASGGVGAHGGKLVPVASDRVEIVANRSSGEVRAYVFDANLNTVRVGSRRITLGLSTDEPEIVVLVPGTNSEYATGKLAHVAEPSAVTIAVSAGAHTHVALVDHVPGAAVDVRTSAPRPAFFAEGSFWAPAARAKPKDDDDDDDDRPIDRAHRAPQARGSGRSNEH